MKRYPARRRGRRGHGPPPAKMANVLSQEKQQKVLVLVGRGWSLRRIQEATGVRRETASAYLRAAGIEIRAPRTRRPPKAASEVSTGFCRDLSGQDETSVSTDPAEAASEVSADPTPASEVSTDPSGKCRAVGPPADDDDKAARLAGRAPSASACERWRALIELELAKGRNAMAIW